jgi:hypothetical protein
MRGVLIAVDSLRTPESFVSFMFSGIIQNQDNRRLNNEIIIESVRARRFPHLTSRLRGLYFFDDLAIAQQAVSQKWGGHFIAKNLVELDLHNDGDLTRVDANWITDAALLSDGRLNPSDLSWIEKYWSGDPKNSSPTWELISGGFAVVPNERVRRRAYAVVQREFPRSWIFIEMHV